MNWITINVGVIGFLQFSHQALTNTGLLEIMNNLKEVDEKVLTFESFLSMRNMSKDKKYGIFPKNLANAAATIVEANKDTTTQWVLSQAYLSQNYENKRSLEQANQNRSNAATNTIPTPTGDKQNFTTDRGIQKTEVNETNDLDHSQPMQSEESNPFDTKSENELPDDIETSPLNIYQV